jgi:hypothetical protein
MRVAVLILLLGLLEGTSADEARVYVVAWDISAKACHLAGMNRSSRFDS